MISVVIPMYNSQETIIAAIKSVIKQSKFDLISEILIVNDGSTDNSLQLVQEFIVNNANNKIKLLQKKNGGVSSARNLGIQNASEEWIALLDSDDVWLNDKIEKQVAYLKNNSKIMFIGTGRNNEKVQIGECIEHGLYRLRTKDLLKKSWPHTSTAIIKKSVILECAMYDETRTHAEDGQLWLKISYNHYLYYLDESLEIAGDNKKTFGEKGLSANLNKMHKGCIQNIREVYHNKYISFFECIYFLIMEYLKYFRRIVVSR